MENEGVNSRSISNQVASKIEELTLYSIEQNKELLRQKEELKQLKAEL